jgi:hypothetical protein
MSEMNRRIEILSEQILKSVGTSEAQAVAEMYARMVGADFVHDFSFIGSRLTPG